jgi:hypothetical protein
MDNTQDDGVPLVGPVEGDIRPEDQMAKAGQDVISRGGPA